MSDLFLPVHSCRLFNLSYPDNIPEFTRLNFQNFRTRCTLEADKLFSERLIRVSSFFRDQKAFEALSEKVLPELFERKKPGSSVRVWVSGCSTGEEAYSLGILLLEALERSGKDLTVQLFATEIDGAAIDYARAGKYPGSIRQDVSKERPERFFEHEDDTYTIRQELREMNVFAVQNLVSQPPFSRLDLVSCRNLLIYMGPRLQKRVLPLFHYVLNPGGYLLLAIEDISGRRIETGDKEKEGL